MASIRIGEYLRRKALGGCGAVPLQENPAKKAERLTFVNDIREVQEDRLREYGAWYSGDADELLNFYTKANAIDYNTDPVYCRNKKSYFWSVSSTESDIKRTHSGQPRNIVDTLVNIIGMPRIGVGEKDGPLRSVDSDLRAILDDNGFARMLMQKARPMTFVEGWGAWKINWDKSVSDYPIIAFYRADSVDFVYRHGGRLAAMIYRDYYQDEQGRDYVLFETRRRERAEDGTACLLIEKELFRMGKDGETLSKVRLSELPCLKDCNDTIKVSNYSGFLGAPSIYFEDSTGDCYGRSIFAGKVDLFDDLDQCHSQAANTVRRSTTHEYFNTLYLEKDERTGMPLMPKDFDRKYVMFRGAKSGDGILGGAGPVQISQPSLDFLSYSSEEQNILLNIISGIMSPATLGIDIAKKDNAEAQREKEKVTIFTRNSVMSEEGRSLRQLCVEALRALEYMRKGEITQMDYDVFVQYDEFADASFEAKLDTVVGAWGQGIMSDEMAIDYLYGETVSPEIRQRELSFLRESREQSNAAMQGNAPAAQGDIGAMLGGENPYDDALAGMDAADAAGDGTDGTGI